MNQQDREVFSAMALKALGYIESIHEEAKLRYSSGENYLDEWLEYTIAETGDLIEELQIMIGKYNCQDLGHKEIFYIREAETICNKHLRVIK